MQLLLDFFPVLAFFIAYKVSGIYVATATLMIAMVLTCLITWARTGKVGNMLLISTLLALVLGAATLLLHDSAFVKWKLTVLDWLFALGFWLAPRFMHGQTLVQKMLGEQLSLTDKNWRYLNNMWIGFFVAVGAINVYVLKHFDEAAWVNFKLFGTLGLTLVFVIGQGVWLAKCNLKHSADQNTPPNP